MFATHNADLRYVTCEKWVLQKLQMLISSRADPLDLDPNLDVHLWRLRTSNFSFAVKKWALLGPARLRGLKGFGESGSRQLVCIQRSFACGCLRAAEEVAHGSRSWWMVGQSERQKIPGRGRTQSPLWICEQIPYIIPLNFTQVTQIIITYEAWQLGSRIYSGR